MRLELSGGFPHGKYLAFKLADGTTFLPRVFEEYGYTDFDVMCIGGGGGNGGSLRNYFGGVYYRAMGGAGGGGGAHRITGLLRVLPDECPVQVGQGGGPGFSGGVPATLTRGDDGGKSSFNDQSCFASGGRGGYAPTFPYSDHIFNPAEGYPSGAHGGQGGLGNRNDPGGGANGGATNLNPDDWSPDVDNPETPEPTPGMNGSWRPGSRDPGSSSVGAGGGGGAGGIGRGLGSEVDRPDPDLDSRMRWDGGVEVYRRSTPGGIGSYSAVNADWVSCPGGYPAMDTVLGVRILPGGAGGANAIDVLQLPLLAGRSFGETRAGENGAVVIAVSLPD